MRLSRWPWQPGRIRSTLLVGTAALSSGCEPGYAKAPEQQKGESMDLQIAGRRALVCAASRGLGRACALALAREGVHVTIVARGAQALAATAKDSRDATEVEVKEVAADITTPEGRAAALGAMPDPDILVNNAGGPPAGNFRDWLRDDWIKALDANMLTAIELIKATIDPMIELRFGRIVNITSSAVKAPIAVLGLSNGARTGLTGFVAGLAREVAPTGVTVNNLLPGPFATDRMEQLNQARARKEGISVDAAREARMRENPTGRVGQPEEFGAACAFICSVQAGFMTGQNVLLDGGAYPGTL
jgi:3-oxoacyl-[acyl-carrier protein] reductase